MQYGLPALRHDWRIPLSHDALGSTFVNYMSGWTELNLGEPQPYPTFYFIGSALWLLHFLLGPGAIITVCIFFSMFLASNRAAAIGRNLGAPYLGQAALSVFSTLNPWVYSKYVAGHIYMIFAYAVILALLAEITRQRPRAVVLLWCAALSVTQIEFFLIVAPLIIIWALYARRLYVVVMIAFSALPVVIGIAAYRSELLSTPFFLPWQEAQSVPILDGLALRGYIFEYASAFQAVLPACYALFVIALAGIPSAFRRPIPLTALCVGFAAFVFASGTKGPISALYQWLVTHVTETGVYRELYDLIALLAIAYIVLIALATAKYRYLAVFAALAASALSIPWITRPAATFFVPARSIPSVRFISREDARVALLPAFQPLTFEGKGSGYDPDLFPRSGQAVPLNGFYPAFPVDAALAFAEHGDLRYAAALSVAQIIERPYLHENTEALRYQLARVPSTLEGRERLGTFIPLLALTDAPKVVSIGDSPLENAVFFGDVYAANPRFRVAHYRAGGETINPRMGWIDVRLIVVGDPAWGNPFGGVYTETAHEWLKTAPGTHVLARTTGAIMNERNQVVASRAMSYRWWRLPAGTTRLRCVGRCAILLSATLPGPMLEHHPLTRFTALPVRTVFPWLFVTTVTRADGGYIRFTERFDAHWLAIFNGKGAGAERLDGALTGFRLPDSGYHGTIYIVQTVALAQAVSEALAVALLALLTVLLTRIRVSVAVQRHYDQRAAAK